MYEDAKEKGLSQIPNLEMIKNAHHTALRLWEKIARLIWRQLFARHNP